MATGNIGTLCKIGPDLVVGRAQNGIGDVAPRASNCPVNMAEKNMANVLEQWDKAISETIVKAIAEQSAALINEIVMSDVNKKYVGMQFLANIKDSDYDYVRDMCRTIGQPRFAEFVGEKWPCF